MHTQHASLVARQPDVKHKRYRHKAIKMMRINKSAGMYHVLLCWLRHSAGNLSFFCNDPPENSPCSLWKLTEGNLVFDQTLCSCPKEGFLVSSRGVNMKAKI